MLAEAVATLLMPMYRPDDAFGMMSVISAQSTARKIPEADAEQDDPEVGDRQDGCERPGSPCPPFPAPKLAYSSRFRPTRSDSRPAGTTAARLATRTRPTTTRNVVPLCGLVEPERLVEIERPEGRPASRRPSGTGAANRRATGSCARGGRRWPTPREPTASHDRPLRDFVDVAVIHPEYDARASSSARAHRATIVARK